MGYFTDLITICRIEVWRLCREFSGTGINHLVYRKADFGFDFKDVFSGVLSNFKVRKSEFFCLENGGIIRIICKSPFHINNILYFFKPEGSDPGDFSDLIQSHPLTKSIKQGTKPFICRPGEDHSEFRHD